MRSGPWGMSLRPTHFEPSSGRGFSLEHLDRLAAGPQEPAGPDMGPRCRTRISPGRRDRGPVPSHAESYGGVVRDTTAPSADGTGVVQPDAGPCGNAVRPQISPHLVGEVRLGPVGPPSVPTRTAAGRRPALGTGATFQGLPAGR